MQSIEINVSQAPLIAIAKIAGYAGDDGYGHVRHAILSVGEVLKGSPSSTISVDTECSQTDLRVWKARSTSVLFIQAPEYYGFRSVIPLDECDFPANLFRADGSAIADPTDLLSYVRQLVRHRPAARVVPTCTLPPSERRRRPLGFSMGDYNAYLVVPADARMEQKARQTLRSSRYDDVEWALQTLRNFKSAQNIALVKQQLRSKLLGPNWAVRPPGLYEVRPFGIREVAYRVLTDDWHVNVEKPPYEERIPRFDEIEELEIMPPIEPGLLDVLGKCPRLRSLRFEFVDLAADQVRQIADLKQVRRLRLESTKSINDSSIPLLARMAGLRDLSLFGTAITDKGLKALADFKNLRTLSVGNTAVTPAGLADFAAKRPDVRL